MEKRVLSLETQSFESQQYSRRDSLEVVGIDLSVPDKDLESKAREIFEEIGVTVEPRDIQACHRLFDNKRTIIKFVNRKTAMEVLSKRSELSEIPHYKKKLYINESLCPHYRYIHGKCKELWQNKKIFGFWIANGTVKYRMQENGHAYKVKHINDLEKIFGVFSK